MKRHRRTLALAWSLAAAAISASTATAAMPPELLSPDELQGRRVDQAALDSQVNAIRKAQELLKRNRATDREAQLLFKLGEAQRRAGAMQFRITYGAAEQRRDAMGATKRFYVQATESFGELIRKFPKSSDLPRAYFLRGRSHSESGNTQAARADYLHLVRNYPKSEDTVPAYMSLAEIAMDKNQWAEAAEHLHFVEKAPSSPYYPHALYRAAWCQYNLKDVGRSLAYIERTIRYYEKNSQNRSDDALRENALQDAAVFFLAGFEQKLSHFEPEDAYTYFKRLDSSAYLGKMLTRYARLLRANGHAEGLAAWKKLVLKEEPSRPESYEIIVIAYEDQLNKRQYGALVQTAHDLVLHRGRHNASEATARAERLLLDAAAQLQTLITRNKGADGVASLTTALAGIYDAFAKIVDEKDPRIPKVHYNLAESLFEIGHFEEATGHYRWVVERGDWNKPAGKDGISLSNASIRAIASRYELLRKNGLIPKDLKPRSLKDAESRELAPTLAEWIQWVDTHFDKARATDVSIDSFVFEANRSIYAHGDLGLALKRLREFALKHPTSKHAPPSATLVVDTYVASADWEGLDKLASELLAVKEWKGTEFAKRLYTLASDADFKAVEASYRAGDYKNALTKARQFLEEYPESNRKADCLSIAGHAALSDKDQGTALDYFAQLMRSAPGTEAAASALLAEGAIREEQFDFAAAGRDFQRYLAVPPALAKIPAKQREALRKKSLGFAWLSGDRRQLRAALADKNLCTGDAALDCERYEVLELFERPGRGPELTSKAFARARRGPVELRALWAALALEGARHLPFRDRHVAIRLFTKNWQQLDSLARTFIVSSVTTSIPNAIALNRRAIGSVAPLLAREAYLIRRLEAIREIENAGIDAAKLPWARIRASVTNELADLYADTARKIASLRGATPEMAVPFLTKSDLLRGKAFQLASASAIEAETFDAIAQPYLHADPKRLAALVPKEPVRKAQPLDVAQLRSLDPDGDWGASSGKCENAAACLKDEWYRSMRSRRFNQATYLIQYAKEKKLLSAGEQALLQAYTLAGMGAQAEALAELAGARSLVAARTRVNINRLLLEHYQNSLAHERASKLREELRRDGESVAQTGSFGVEG